jgi:hypothetical protein
VSTPKERYLAHQTRANAHQRPLRRKPKKPASERSREYQKYQLPFTALTQLLFGVVKEKPKT